MNVVSTHIMKDDSAKCGVLRNMNLLPLEIVHRILEYDGRMKYRHGKYMNQIAQDDDRYKMLQTLPQIDSNNSDFMSSHKNNFHIYKYTSSLYSYEKPLTNIIIRDTARYYYFIKDSICISHHFMVR